MDMVYKIQHPKRYGNEIIAKKREIIFSLYFYKHIYSFHNVSLILNKGNKKTFNKNNFNLRQNKTIIRYQGLYTPI